MRRVISDLLRRHNIHPILFEIGAVDYPAPVWDDIAGDSVYIGIGPDSKSCSRYRDGFYQAVLLDEVVTPSTSGPITLHLTKDPIYSSILEPDPHVLCDSLANACALDRTLIAEGTTVSKIMSRLALDAIDWLNTNVSGIDSAILQSVPREIRDKLLAFDTVFDLTDLWVQPGSPLAGYATLVDQGFWASRLRPYGFVRMQPASLELLRRAAPTLNAETISAELRPAPEWIFVRFFRTLSHLNGGSFSNRDYILLWSFALLDGQMGFAVDVALAYQARFGADDSFRSMLAESTRQLQEVHARARRRRLRRRFVPDWVRRAVQSVFFS
jgi:hypothetical protein